ncbi:MMPL family transporter [Streptomyces sp. MAR4 CNY-716]
MDNNSVAIVDSVRDGVQDLPGYGGVTGPGAGVIDWQQAVYDNFPYVLALIALITFILLVRAFRSLLLPFKAVVLNMFSVGAVFGITTWFWQEGNGSDLLFGIEGTGAIPFWLPVVIFAFLFGLSMDYEVFILARMREEYDRSGSTSYAVEHGLGRTGRLVTSAALILFFAFAASPLLRAPISRSWPPPSASGSSSTPPWCGPCWCQPRCPCSASTTGGSRSASRGSCGSNPRRSSPR